MNVWIANLAIVMLLSVCKKIAEYTAVESKIMDDLLRNAGYSIVMSGSDWQQLSDFEKLQIAAAEAEEAQAEQNLSHSFVEALLGACRALPKNHSRCPSRVSPQKLRQNLNFVVCQKVG
jgi:hypothetical protein